MLVSGTVRDSSSGSGIAFEDRGEHELKGIGPRRVFAVLELRIEWSAGAAAGRNARWPSTARFRAARSPSCSPTSRGRPICSSGSVVTATRSSCAEHSRILREAVAEHDGRVVDTQGDSLFCVFRSAHDAVSATIEAQHALAAHAWPDDVRVRVRMGLHSGEPKASDAGYIGIGVHRAARVGAAAHGAQVLLSETARALVADDLPPGVSLRDLGLHRLKDLDEPARLYQVVVPGLEDRFSPLRTLRRRRTRGRLALIAVGSGGRGRCGCRRAALDGIWTAKPVRLLANSIAVVDPTSGKPVADVPLGFSPTAVDAGGDDVWVLNTPARTATAIDPETLEIVQTVGVHGDPDSQYAVGGTDWVAFAGGVDEIDSSGAHRDRALGAGRDDPCERQRNAVLRVRHRRRSKRLGVGGPRCRGHRRGRRKRSPQAATSGRTGIPAEPHLLRPPVRRRCAGRDPKSGLFDRDGRPELRLVHADRHQPIAQHPAGLHVRKLGGGIRLVLGRISRRTARPG